MATTKIRPNPFHLPSESESRILGYVLRQHGATQPEIVKASGLSQQTVSRLVNDLVLRGALRLGAHHAQVLAYRHRYGVD